MRYILLETSNKGTFTIDDTRHFEIYKLKYEIEQKDIPKLLTTADNQLEAFKKFSKDFMDEKIGKLRKNVDKDFYEKYLELALT